MCTPLLSFFLTPSDEARTEGGPWRHEQSAPGVACDFFFSVRPFRVRQLNYHIMMYGRNRAINVKHCIPIVQCEFFFGLVGRLF